MHFFKSYQNFKMKRGKTENWEKIRRSFKKTKKKSRFVKEIKKTYLLIPSCSISLCSRKTWGKGNFLVHWSQANWYLSFWWQLKTWAFKYFLACDEKSHKLHLNGLFTRSPWCATDMWFRSPCFNTILSHKGHFTFFFSWTVSMWIRNFVLFANDFMQDGHWCLPPDFNEVYNLETILFGPLMKHEWVKIHAFFSNLVVQ